VTGTGTDSEPRSTYLYHVVDNEHTMREYGSQAVVWQTAINPVVALELLDEGAWKGAGVLGPEAFPRRRSSSASPSSAHPRADGAADVLEVDGRRYGPVGGGCSSSPGGAVSVLREK